MIVGALVTGYKSGITSDIVKSAAVIRLLVCIGRYCSGTSIRKHSTLFILTCDLLELSWLLFVIDGC